MTDAIWTRDGGQSVYDLAVADAYKTKLPYPERVKEPEVLRKRAGELSAHELGQVTQVKADYDAAKIAFDVARVAFHQDNTRLEAQFRADLEAENGMTGHPKADMLWHKAWSDGHSAGLTEVANVYGNLVDLVL